LFDAIREVSTWVETNSHLKMAGVIFNYIKLLKVDDEKCNLFKIYFSDISYPYPTHKLMLINVDGHINVL